MISADLPPLRASLALLIETVDPRPQGGIADLWVEVRRLTAGLRELLLGAEARSPLVEGLREVLASLCLTPLDERAQRSSLRAAREALARIASGEGYRPGPLRAVKRRRAAWRRLAAGTLLRRPAVPPSSP